MADGATHHQSSFLGGEWGALSQGRSDLEAYKQALNLCLNAVILEEGGWSRRTGFEWMAYPRGRTAAKLLPFLSSASTPFLMEFTNLVLRFHFGTGPVCTNDRRTVTASTFAAGELTLTVDASHGWVVNDFVRLDLQSTAILSDVGAFVNRVFKITATPAVNQITLRDDLGVVFSVPASVPANALIGTRVLRIKQYIAPYATASLDGLRAVQAEEECLILSASALPQIVTLTTEASGDGDPTITFTASDLQDGPYLDRQETAPGVPETGTVSAYTGTITFTPASSTFSASDVGRLIRLFSEPAAWNSATTYAYGETVKYGGSYWKSLAQGAYATLNVNIVPGTVPPLSTGSSVNLWAPAALEGRWAWGTITAQAGASCTVALETGLNSVNGATISEWRLGLFTTGSFPTCGLWHDGRLYLAGAAGNRLDASAPNKPYTFSPSDIYGTVNDDAAVSATLNSKDINTFYWMEPDPQGILIVTAGGEFLFSASELNDPITPTNRQANKVTKYRARNVEPVRAGVALIFAQLYGQRSLEYLADTYSQRFTARHLNERAKHLAVDGIEEMVYQEEPAPVVWHRMGSGLLAGATYRRVSRFITEEPLYQAWHQHTLGGGRTVTSMCVLPSVDGLGDRLYVVTLDAVSGYYGIEVATPQFEGMPSD